MSIVVDVANVVKAYLKRIEEGLPEAERPRRCGRCRSKRRPHRHGWFWRTVFTRMQRWTVPVLRFRCPDCKKTMSLPPNFVESHHQTAVDVKEEVIRQRCEQRSLAEIAKETLSATGGSYAEKTLWRWLRDWEARRARQEAGLWSLLLCRGLDEPLPRERKNAWSALFVIWPQTDDGESLLSALLRLDRSFALAPV